MPSSSRLLVVGGGLGGLGLALAMGRRGREVQCWRQAAEIAPIGYGIQLGPNVFPVFDELGITDAVLEAAHVPPALVMPDTVSGEELIRIALDTPQFQQRFRDPYVVIHRGDLHNILLDACRDTSQVELTPSATVTRYEDTGDRVIVQTKEGRTYEGAAMVAADGVRSRLRETLVDEAGPVPIGYVAHRTTVPMSDIPAQFPYRDEVFLWAGPGHHVVHYPLRNGTVFNIVAVFKSDLHEQTDADDATGYAAEFRDVFREAHPTLKCLLDLMDLDRRWVLSDRDPIRHWFRGRVALLGDAAHPALQSYAQGAGMALEDAACLAGLLTDPDADYTQAFAGYQKARLLRTARLQLESRSLWEFYHCGGIARDVRNAELATRTADDFYRCLGWLWDSVQYNHPGSTGSNGVQA